MTTERRPGPARRLAVAAAAVAAAVAVGGCRQDMHDQPRLDPLEASTFFADGMASRLPVEGTVARGQLNEGPAYTGRDASGAFATTLPMTVDRGVLLRGQQRYDIFCAPCHGATGEGDGMVVMRGFTPPPSLHDERLRNEAVGYFFDVMTSGFGQMPSYAPQVTPEDRWAIAAYVRVLQLARDVRLAELPEADRVALEQSLTTTGVPPAPIHPPADPEAPSGPHGGSEEH